MLLRYFFFQSMWTSPANLLSPNTSFESRGGMLPALMPWWDKDEWSFGMGIQQTEVAVHDIMHQEGDTALPLARVGPYASSVNTMPLSAAQKRWPTPIHGTLVFVLSSRLLVLNRLGTAKTFFFYGAFDFFFPKFLFFLKSSILIDYQIISQHCWQLSRTDFDNRWTKRSR